MPTKVLLSADAAVEEKVLPVGTKKRVKAGNAKPFIPKENRAKKKKKKDSEDGEDGDDGDEEPPVKKQKQKGPRPKGGLPPLPFG